MNEFKFILHVEYPKELSTDDMYFAVKTKDLDKGTLDTAFKCLRDGVLSTAHQMRPLR